MCGGFLWPVPPVARGATLAEAGGVGSAGRFRLTLALLAYGMLVFLVFTFGTLFELVVTRGVCFVYVISYFLALVVVLAVRRVGRFGTGVAVFLPYAILGFFAEYMMEVVVEPNLIAPWAAVIWSLNGPVAGLSADAAHRFLPAMIRGAPRAALVGVVLVSAYWVLVLLTLAFLYRVPGPGLAHYLNGIPLTLPWLLVSGAFGGYTAHAMSASKGA